MTLKEREKKPGKYITWNLIRVGTDCERPPRGTKLVG